MVTPTTLILSVFNTLQIWIIYYLHARPHHHHITTHPWQKPTHCHRATSLAVSEQISWKRAAVLLSLSSGWAACIWNNNKFKQCNNCTSTYSMYKKMYTYYMHYDCLLVPDLWVVALCNIVQELMEDVHTTHTWASPPCEWVPCLEDFKWPKPVWIVNSCEWELRFEREQPATI